MTNEEPDLGYMSIEDITEFCEKIKHQEYDEKFHNLVKIFKFLCEGKNFMNKEKLKDVLINNNGGNSINNEEFEEMCLELNLTSENTIDIEKYVTIMLSK